MQAPQLAAIFFFDVAAKIFQNSSRPSVLWSFELKQEKEISLSSRAHVFQPWLVSCLLQKCCEVDALVCLGLCKTHGSRIIITDFVNGRCSWTFCFKSPLERNKLPIRSVGPTKPRVCQHLFLIEKSYSIKLGNKKIAFIC